MKKLISATLAATLALSLAACGSSASTSEAAPAESTASSAAESAAESTAETSELAGTTLKVAASPTPHAEILNVAKEVLAEQGIDLQVVEFSDYVQPNLVTESGEVDANYFQHTPYLNSYNASNGTDLVSAAKIHYEPFGLYGNGVASVADIQPGTTILIPADDSNETRALFLLAQEGLIDLPEEASAETGVTTLDIKDDHGFDIQAVQADTVPTQLANSAQGTVAVINGNYALQAGLHTEDALAVEDASGDAAQTYANVIAVRNGDENTPKIKALISALETDSVKQYIADKYHGAVVAMF